MCVKIGDFFFNFFSYLAWKMETLTIDHIVSYCGRINCLNGYFLVYFLHLIFRIKLKIWRDMLGLPTFLTKCTEDLSREGLNLPWWLSVSKTDFSYHLFNNLGIRVWLKKKFQASQFQDQWHQLMSAIWSPVFTVTLVSGICGFNNLFSV